MMATRAARPRGGARSSRSTSTTTARPWPEDDVDEPGLRDRRRRHQDRRRRRRRARARSSRSSRVESPATDAAAIEAAIETLVTELRTRHHDRGGRRRGGRLHRQGARRRAVRPEPGLARPRPQGRPRGARSDLPVVVENDANAAAWGEFQFGAGHDVDDLLLVTVGTGVGGGVVLDGALYRGAFGVGAEIGHMRVVPDGILCGCGNRGCFEKYASGSALVREARAAARAGSLLAPTCWTAPAAIRDAITGPLITEAARDGDPFALEQLGVARHVARRGHRLADRRARPGRGRDRRRRQRGGRPAARAGPGGVRCPAHRRGHRPMLEIRSARLGNRAGLIGAADLTRH